MKKIGINLKYKKESNSISELLDEEKNITKILESFCNKYSDYKYKVIISANKGIYLLKADIYEKKFNKKKDT